MCSTASEKAHFILPDDQPIVRLEVETAFNGLTTSEKLYSHYVSQASWYGGLVVLFQTSPESPDIFRLIHTINTAESVESLKEKSLAAGLSETEFTAYLIYCSGFYANMGNYKGFGDCKFVPNIDQAVMEKLVKSSAAFASKNSILDIWNKVKDKMFSLSDKERQLGLGEKGVTKYFSANCEAKDSDVVNAYLKHKNIEGYNNRVIKTEEGGKTVYEIRKAAVQNSVLCEEEYKGCTFKVTTGDYQQLLQKVCENLTEAEKHCANDLEKNMLKQYCLSFQTGSLDNHKDGSRYWIKNKGPMVETYIGFIENYRDPAGMRGEFEGFVSVVNKKMSEKFQVLVDRAEELLPQLPWPKEFEKDAFLRPDFTSLDVLSFAGSGVPAGINIPNYDEIRQSEGFKNVSLGNVISSSYGGTKRSTFVTLEDDVLIKKWKVPSFELQVGLHELLGHGSGKLFYKEDKAIKDPFSENGDAISSWYEAGDGYDSKFTTIGSSYEECRAECAGLHLCMVPGVTEIFGYSGEEAEHIKYVNWLSMVHAGVKGVEMFSPGSMEWKQAHSQARFVIMNVMLEAGEGFLKIEKVTGEDGKPDLLISMDRSKLESVGQPAIAKFLNKLQVLKSTADDKTARVMYGELSAVTGAGEHPWLAWREIVVARKQPRSILVQGNTRVENEKLELVQYDPSPAGMVQSWKERFPDMACLDKIIVDVAEKEGNHWA